jgi:hypothetical protein
MSSKQTRNHLLHILSGRGYQTDTRLSELGPFLHATSILAIQSARVPDDAADCMQVYQIKSLLVLDVLGGQSNDQ